METIFLGKNCIEVKKTDSTNSYLARLTSSDLTPNPSPGGVFEGTVVVAKHQEQGRGQRGATWESEPDKNLTLSILLQPTFLRPDEQFMLNKAVSLGVMEFVVLALTPSLSPAGEECRIKWPNDIYIGNKKVAGILIENSVSGDKLLQSIIGIGINVNQEKFSSKLPNPTSLKLIAGEEFDLKECLAQLFSCIESRYLELRSPHHNLELRSQPSLSAQFSNGEGTIDSDYLKNLYRFGEWAEYKYNGKIIKSKIIGITKLGKLMMETEKGKTVECDFKEVEFC